MKPYPTAASPAAPVSLKEIVTGGYCIGCGACAAMAGGGLRMGMDAWGCYEPRHEVATGLAAAPHEWARVCPFNNLTENENTLGKRRFGATCQWHDRIGYYAACHAGYVLEGDYRARGSSGGLGSWLLTEMLRAQWVDAVIHVVPGSSPMLFGYRISRSVSEVMAGGKSRYYPIEMSGVMEEVRRHPGRYVLVGLPCFVKAAHLLCQADRVLGERIRFTVGLVCGHLKSARYADMLGWQFGVQPGQLTAIDFRHKLVDQPAHLYATEVTCEREGQPVREIRANSDLFGLDWGYGLFQYPACDYCDDVLAETADVTIGDAWLPRFVGEGQGTNIVVVRHPGLGRLLADGAAAKRLWLVPLTADEIALSQQGGLRHRRAGLAYRLHLKQVAGIWHPTKRVEPSWRHLSTKRRRILRLRIGISRTSHLAYAAAVRMGDFKVFSTALAPLVDLYHDLYRIPWWHQVVLRSLGVVRRKLRALMHRLFGRG